MTEEMVMNIAADAIRTTIYLASPLLLEVVTLAGGGGMM